MVDVMCGTDVQTHQETLFIPREVGDVQVNELYTAAATRARDLRARGSVIESVCRSRQDI